MLQLRLNPLLTLISFQTTWSWMLNFFFEKRSWFREISSALAAPFFNLVQLVRKVDNTIQRIAWFGFWHIHSISIYPAKSVIQHSSNWGLDLSLLLHGKTHSVIYEDTFSKEGTLPLRERLRTTPHLNGCIILTIYCSLGNKRQGGIDNHLVSRGRNQNIIAHTGLMS